jgi:two-component system NtrC family response regulator
VVYLDVHLPDGTGLDAITQLAGGLSEPEVIIMTGESDPDGAEMAIKNGAWDYFAKPSSLSAMLKPLVRALQYRDARKQAPPIKILNREGIVGNSVQLKGCLGLIAQASAWDANVLITGDTGTGKELAARTIHANSPRSDGNFIVVDCASLTETLVESALFGYQKGAYTGAERSHDGLIRQADRGTLFLDEVEELTPSTQRAFLRVLEEHSFRPLGAKQEVKSDFRLIAATNRDLDEMVRAGLFRSDLLYRLRSFCINLPPLRERRDDIPELVSYHLLKVCERYGVEIKGVSLPLMDMFKTYDWPGNVRELLHMLEGMVAAAITHGDPILVPRNLPLNIRVDMARKSVSASTPAMKQQNSQPHVLPAWQDVRKRILGDAEKEYISQLMSATKHDIKKACEISGLSRSRIYQFTQKYPRPDDDKS